MVEINYICDWCEGKETISFVFFDVEVSDGQEIEDYVICAHCLGKTLMNVPESVVKISKL